MLADPVIARLSLAAWMLGLLASPTTASASRPQLRVSDNGHFLVTAEGKPFFWLGDTAWYLLYYTTFDDIDHYLADRKAKGFNVLQVISLTPRERSGVAKSEPGPATAGQRLRAPICAPPLQCCHAADLQVPSCGQTRWE